MKIYLSMVLAAILVTGSAVAQHSSQKATIGVKAGLNIYNISNDNGANYAAKPGFNAGLLGHVHLVPHWALQPELVYSVQGAKGSGASAEIKNNLHYINVPVLIQYMFDNGFRLQAGPQVGFLVNAQQKIGSEASKDIKDSYSSADLGLGMGISYVHPSTGFGIDLRYNHGLTDINKNSTVKSTNRGGQIGIFYLFSHQH